jgi:hypothetical protein
VVRHAGEARLRRFEVGRVPPAGRRALIPRAGRVQLAAALAALAVAGCGSSKPAKPPAQPLSSLQSANCLEWRAIDRDRRIATIHALTKAVGGPTNGGRGATLSDARAYRLFQRVCRNTFTSHFLLYEMYNRAAGFKSLGPSG